MKDLDHIETPETDKVVIEQNVQKQTKLLGSQRKIPGLTMFEFNYIDMTLVPAVYKEETVIFNASGTPTVRSKLVCKDNCVYVQALNKKNAYKKILKQYKKATK